jgi:acyl-coenzyme A synthetase/AMP-(fatty) acid ligase
MNFNGINIYPREIEISLEAHPAVAEAASLPITSNTHGQIPVAVVSLQFSATEQELLTHCQMQLGLIKAPKHIVILPKLPRNNAGKILKRDLSSLFQRTQSPINPKLVSRN